MPKSQQHHQQLVLPRSVNKTTGQMTELMASRTEKTGDMHIELADQYVRPHCLYVTRRHASLQHDSSLIQYLAITITLSIAARLLPVILQQLHWLPVRHRIAYKLAVLTYKVGLYALPRPTSAVTSNRGLHCTVRQELSDQLHCRQLVVGFVIQVEIQDFHVRVRLLSRFRVHDFPCPPAPK